MNSNNFEKKKSEILNLFKEKKYDLVIRLGTNLLKKKTNDPQLIYLLGLASINLEKFLDAEKYFKNLLTLQKSAELYFIYSNILKKIEKYNESISALENAININPNFPEALNNLGIIKNFQNKQLQAIKYFKKSLNLKKDNPQALYYLADIYKNLKNYDDLIIIYKKILDLDNKNIKALYNLGSTYLFYGNIKEGRKYFEKVLEIDKLHFPSIRNYISITKIEKKNKIFTNLPNIKTNNLSNQNKILLFDSLSKGNFDLENNILGFEYLNKLNLLKKNKTSFSLINEKEKFKKIQKFFKNSHKHDFNYKKSYKTKPIFIIGMPRSGTSLLEQILSSHSKIYGAGELNFLTQIIDKLGLEKPDDLKKFYIKIREYYHNRISNITDKNYIIDKLPTNFRWTGFIINAMPEAKIIHIERNPMAVCWSNYKTNFINESMDFNLTQEDTANYYVLYLEMMRFWLSKFDKVILNVNYDEFVKNFELNSKPILDYLNIDWEDNLKNYNKTKRAVSTASYQQVRGGILKDTSQIWKKYSSHLNVMLKILKDNQVEF